jgi:hypothetical protein
MTEAEWLTATDPTLMLKSLKESANARKLHLLAAVCYQRLWAVLGKDSYDIVKTNEIIADQPDKYEAIQAIRPPIFVELSELMESIAESQC